MQRTDELKQPPIIGKYYFVPCAQHDGLLPPRMSWVPLLFPVHNDLEIIKFRAEHYHLDWRFLTVKQIQHLNIGGDRWAGIVANQSLLTSEIVWMKRRCQREMPIFPAQIPVYRVPAIFETIRWLPVLEHHYQHSRLSPCSKCPHQGIDLSSIPARDGIKVCPGHGLAWKEDGTMHPRTLKEYRSNS